MDCIDAPMRRLIGAVALVEQEQVTLFSYFTGDLQMSMTAIILIEWNFPMTVVNLCRITNRRVTTNGCPFRKHTPYCGWVTLAMAGFLACGSNAPALPSQFPSGFVKQSLTAYSCEGSQGFGLSDRPVLVPYCFP